MRGFPYWPARIDCVRPRDCNVREQGNDPDSPDFWFVSFFHLFRCYRYISWPIFFFGTHQISWIPESNLRVFEENRETLGKNKHIKEAMRVSIAKASPATKNIFRKVSPTLPSSFSSGMEVEKLCQKCGTLVKLREDGFVLSPMKQQILPSGMFTAERKKDDWKLRNQRVDLVDQVLYLSKNHQRRICRQKRNH